MNGRRTYPGVEPAAVVHAVGGDGGLALAVHVRHKLLTWQPKLNQNNDEKTKQRNLNNNSKLERIKEIYVKRFPKDKETSMKYEEN